jgi:seryl-tRNA synthetase
MLDIKFIRENPDLVAKGARDKNFKIEVTRLLELDSACRNLQSQTESLQADRNRLSKNIAAASPSEREALKSEVQDIKRKMDELTPQLESARKEFDAMMLLVPAPARSDVPIGKDDTGNVEVKKWGKIPEFKFEPLDHAVIGERLDIIDFSRGVKLAGSRSYILKGDGARLEQAILRYTFDKLCERGYTPMTVPVLVKEDAMTGTGYFPTGRDQAYYIEKDERALVGTAEVSLTSYHSGEILQETELPCRTMSWSSCFRREAGTYGKDTKGLYRVHQFQKIEQVIIAPADAGESEKLHAELLKNAEDILQDFGLAYRVVYVCTGDLGQGQVRKHDIETWMPSRQTYSETHSCSTFHDFQARRLGMRYRTKSGEVKTCYTLNNTAIATPRVMIPILECYQQADGSVRIPDALIPYMQGQKVIAAPK